MKLLNAFILNILLIGGLTVNSCNQARAAEINKAANVKPVTHKVPTKTVSNKIGFSHFDGKVSPALKNEENQLKGF